MTITELFTHREALMQRECLMADADARLLRQWKAFLLRHGYKEGLWCQRCDRNGLPTGVHATVTENKIDLECRCGSRRFRGQTY